MTIENTTPPDIGSPATGGLRKGWADRMLADAAQTKISVEAEPKSRRQGLRRRMVERDRGTAGSVDACNGRRATRLNLPGRAGG